MLDRIERFKTPRDCEIFEKNAAERGRPDLAVAARQKAVRLRAEEYGAETTAERECLEAIFAYEQAISAKNGKKTRAIRTWRMIQTHGILAATERAVERKAETLGYNALVEMGLENYAFEAVILRHPASFSEEAINRAEARIKTLKNA